MKRIVSLIFLNSLLMGFYSCPSHPELSRPVITTSQTSILKWVNPKIGSGGFPWARGNVSPAASAPFGRIKVGPDTTFMGKRTSTSGYGALDTHLLGFSHTRLSGTGAFEGGLLRMLPYHQKFSNAGELSKKQVLMSRNTEVSSPGFYSVYLPGPKVQVDLAATQRTALHRYRFHSEQKRMVYLHLNSFLYDRGSVTEVATSIDAAQKKVFVSGRLKDAFSGRYGGQPFFFELSFDSAWSSHEYFSATQNTSGTSWSPSDSGGAAYLALDFGEASAPSDILIRVGLSYVSQSGATDVLALESGATSLDDLLAATRSSWEDLLNRITVEGGTDAQNKIFYTALYHSFLMPVVMDDPSGAVYTYLGFDKNIHTASHPFYSDLSLWDTFRTVHPLYNLILKDKHPDILSSLLLMAEQSGQLPRWAAGSGNANSMMGIPGLIVMSEAAQKGLAGWDSDLGFTWATTMLTPGAASGQECLRQYVEQGFCPDTQKGSVSYAQDYAYAFESYSKWANLRGQSDIAQNAHSLALNFKNHYSPARGFFVPMSTSGAKDEGISEDDNSYLSMTRAGKAFVEGGAWHWAFGPMILASEVFALDANNFHTKLDNFFKRGGRSIGSPYGAYGYWHGNEHDFHAPYMFALTGRLDLTHQWTDFVMSRKYSAKDLGLDGDDDGGAISSWYVWSAMGVFPIAGTDQYVLGTPLFKKVTVDMGAGKTLVIESDKSRSELDSPYIAGAQVGGSPLSSPIVSESQIQDGTTINFTRSQQPVRSW
jgi:predicted alpha-1,2-mannosidase